MLKSAVLCHLSMRHEGHEKTKCGGKTGRALLPGKWTMLWRSEWRKLRKIFEIMNAKIRQLHVAGWVHGYTTPQVALTKAPICFNKGT